MNKSRSNMSGSHQPVKRVTNMGRKSFGSLTGGVLATLFLAIASISFSEICFLEPVAAQSTSDRKAEVDRLLQQVWSGCISVLQ